MKYLRTFATLLAAVVGLAFSASAADRYAPKSTYTLPKSAYRMPTYTVPRTPTYTVPRTPVYRAPSFSLPSPRVTPVSPYIKRNGTYVAPHFRTTPDRSFNNNFSTYPNINPYTGKVGTRAPRGY